MEKVTKIATQQSYGESLKATREYGKIVTCEEHSAIGGLGKAVCAVIAQHGLACPVERVVVNNEFGHSGPAGELLKQVGLCADYIARVAGKLLTV